MTMVVEDVQAQRAAAGRSELVAASEPVAGHVRAGSEIVAFRLGDEEYGIDILKVQEIRSYTPPTRIAQAPSYIKGVINLRGVIVPIVDLRVKFALPSVEYSNLTVVIVLRVADRVVGTVVDAVSDVLHLEPSQIRPAPEFSSAVDSAFITGIGTISDGAHVATSGVLRDRMLILVDIEKLLASANVGIR